MLLFQAVLSKLITLVVSYSNLQTFQLAFVPSSTGLEQLLKCRLWGVGSLYNQLCL